MEIEESYNLDHEIMDLDPFLGDIYSHDLPLMTSNHRHPSSSSSSSPRLISFECSNTHHTLDYNSNQEREEKNHSLLINFSSSFNGHDSSKNPSPYDDVANGVTRKSVSTMSRTQSQARDHVMAERKRRENLSQLFINLSKVVPGLRKLDKASLLEDAINYLKALQQRVSELEEMKKNTKDVVLDNSCSYKEINTMNYNNIVPEISVRIAERHVLVKIWCKKEMEMVSRIPCELEKMNLNVIDTRMMPFGEEALHLTILAQMQSKFGGTVKDIVNHFQPLFFNFSAANP